MIRANMPKIIMTVMVIVWLMRITMVFAMNLKSRVAPIQLPATMMRLPLRMMVHARLQVVVKIVMVIVWKMRMAMVFAMAMKSWVVRFNRIQSTIMQPRIQGHARVTRATQVSIVLNVILDMRVKHAICAVLAMVAMVQHVPSAPIQM